MHTTTFARPALGVRVQPESSSPLSVAPSSFAMYGFPVSAIDATTLSRQV